MVILPIALKLTRANAHKGQAVTVGLVHIGLDLKDKRGKVRRKSVDHALITFP